MTKSWPLLALAVFGAAAAAFSMAAFDWTIWACRLPTTEDGKVLTPGIGGCIEFWLNRYQTLISAVAALLAGYAAWRGAMNQVARADTQIMLLNKQTSVDRIEYINNKIIPIDRVRTSINQIHIYLNSTLLAVTEAGRIANLICETLERDVAASTFALEDEFEDYVRRYGIQMKVIFDLIRKVSEAEDDATLPETIRKCIINSRIDAIEFHDILQKFAGTMENVMVMYPRDNNSVLISYRRRAERLTEFPKPFDMVRTNSFDLIDAEYQKLLKLRRAAEAVVEFE